ncbi:MAG: hypothetical protein V1909_02570 [Candidatus Micrarchaeota archaeon]
METKTSRKANWSPDLPIALYCPGKRNAPPFYALFWNPHEPLKGKDGLSLSWKPGSLESGMSMTALKRKPGEFGKIEVKEEMIMRERELPPDKSGGVFFP